jgi:hypothetical protein
MNFCESFFPKERAKVPAKVRSLCKAHGMNEMHDSRYEPLHPTPYIRGCGGATFEAGAGKTGVPRLDFANASVSVTERKLLFLP